MFLQLCLYPATRSPVSSPFHTLFVKVKWLSNDHWIFLPGTVLLYPTSVFATPKNMGTRFWWIFHFGWKIHNNPTFGPSNVEALVTVNIVFSWTSSFCQRSEGTVFKIWQPVEGNCPVLCYMEIHFSQKGIYQPPCKTTPPIRLRAGPGASLTRPSVWQTASTSPSFHVRCTPPKLPGNIEWIWQCRWVTALLDVPSTTSAANA